MTNHMRSFAPNDLDRYDTIIFDIDGVLCRGAHQFIPQIPETITDLITTHKKRVLLCTNNSTKHHDDYFKLFHDANIPLESSCLYTAASTLASHVQHELTRQPTGSKVLLIGEPGLFQEFADRGLDDSCIVRIESLTTGLATIHDLIDLQIDPAIKIVAIGLSAKWDYASCCVVEILMQDHDPILLATSRVCNTTVSPTRQLPAVGSILLQLEKSLPDNVDKVTGQCKKQFLPMGKPAKYMFDAMCRDYPEIDPSRTLMIGDRIDSDVAFGQACGLDTLLVFSGVTNRDYYLNRCQTAITGSQISPAEGITMDENSEAVLDSIFPTYYADDITFMILKNEH